MRKLLLGLLALTAMLVPLSAQATTTSDAAFLNGYTFASPRVCMSIGDNGLEAAAMAQQWNLRDNGVIAITASSNCVTAGFPANRRFTIEAYNGSCTWVFKLTDKHGDAFDPAGDATPVDGNWQYDDNPIMWINRNCWGSSDERRHMVSAGIGSVMGLATLNSAGNNARVMNMTAFSRSQVPQADAGSAAVLHRFYWLG